MKVNVVFLSWIINADCSGLTDSEIELLPLLNGWEWFCTAPEWGFCEITKLWGDVVELEKF